MDWPRASDLKKTLSRRELVAILAAMWHADLTRAFSILRGVEGFPTNGPHLPSLFIALKYTGCSSVLLGSSRFRDLLS